MTSEAAVAVRPLQAGATEDNAKRRQILEGARAVFLAQGFDAASMGEIARAAGVSKGTLYVYFESKEELFEAIVHRQCEAQAEGLFDLAADDVDVEAALTRLGVGFVSFLCQPDKASPLRTVIAIADRMPEIGKKFYESGPACGKPLCRLYFHLSNARHSKTFYDIVFVIDAYRLFQLMTPEMPCIRSGRFSSRERFISETCISR